jgi:hypothetical protein
LLSVEEKVLGYFANGTEVEVERIRPRLEFVDTQFKADLFRYASLLWSIPVSFIDQWIGWDVPRKNERLYHVMDVYVLGAYLLGGKLVASDEVREMFRQRYAQKAVREPHLVFQPWGAPLSTTASL